jgi:hypothetical protein
MPKAKKAAPVGGRMAERAGEGAKK